MAKSRQAHVVVVGAGVGGLTAAALLAARGVGVTVLERSDAVGGKVHAVDVEGTPVDTGPTVVTMRWILDPIFASVGAPLDEALSLRPAICLHRHAWPDGSQLDLYADLARTVDAIAAFAGPEEAAAYRAFVDYARTIYDAVEGPFIRSQKPTLRSLSRHYRAQGLRALSRIDVRRTLWKALSSYFADPRLRQLFGRYATYYGASPFRAPATLNLISHVEREGVWIVDGGVTALVQQLAARLVALGGQIRTGAEVAAIQVTGGRAAGVQLATGESLAADAVISNTDVNALSGGLLGPEVRKAARGYGPRHRSLSAVTWATRARVSGFPLAHHTVFFSRDYPGEFRRIFRDRRLPDEPTVYICAQDRGPDGEPPDARRSDDGTERLLLLVNAPARGDIDPLTDEEVRQCESQMLALLSTCGLQLSHRSTAEVRTTPNEWAARFPGTGGALYGPLNHGWRASFRRAGARSAVPGLYLVGGSVHPGAGVPMAALSGQLATDCLLEDLSSSSPSRPGATSGGT